MKGMHQYVFTPSLPSPPPLPSPPHTTQGTHVWLAENRQWIPAVVTAATATEVTFSSPYGQVQSAPQHAAYCTNTPCVVALSAVRLYRVVCAVNTLHTVPPSCPAQEYTRAKLSLSADSVAVMHETSVQSVEDMSALGDLHEAAILYNIHQRYRVNKIYVSSGGGVGQGVGQGHVCELPRPRAACPSPCCRPT